MVRAVGWVAKIWWEKGFNSGAVATDTKDEDYKDIFVKVSGQQELVKKEVPTSRGGGRLGGLRLESLLKDSSFCVH